MNLLVLFPSAKGVTRIEYDDLEVRERVRMGAFALVYKGFWKSQDTVVAVKCLTRLNHKDVRGKVSPYRSFMLMPGGFDLAMLV